MAHPNHKLLRYVTFNTLDIEIHADLIDDRTSRLTILIKGEIEGFQFEDKGHINEQITWLTNVEMDFYANGIKKTLK